MKLLATPDAYLVSYPSHCGQPTQLSVYGWRCGPCGVYVPFAATKKGRSTRWGTNLGTTGQPALRSRATPADKGPTP